MNIDNITLNYIYKLIFDELTILEFKSLTKLQQHSFIEAIFKSRAHFLILDFFNKHSDLKKNSYVYKKAKKITSLSTMHSIIHYEESFRLNKIFKKNNLKFVFLKGIHLINNYYDDFMYRPIRDIDILIDKSDIDEVINVLLKNGYSFQKDINHLNLVNFLNNSYDLPILVSASGAKLEVHFSIEKLVKNKTCAFTRDFLSDSKELNLNEHALPTLSEEDLILHLIYHRFKKQGPDVGVIFIADIYKVISANKFNHSLLIKKARKYKLLSHLKIMIVLLCSKSNKKVFHDINSMILYDINKDTLESLEFLFIRNDIYPEEIKLFQFLKKLEFKSTLNYFDSESLNNTIINYNYKNRTLNMIIYQFLRIFRHFRILILTILKIIFSKSYRAQVSKLKRVLFLINKF